MKQKPPAASTLHQKILGDIEGRIVSGEWPPGHRLPFEVELAKSYDVSRMTVNKVLTKLAGAGLIERRKKSGSFVAQPRVQSAILEIHDIREEVEALGLPYRYECLSREIRTAGEDDEWPATSGTRLVVLACRHFAGAQPFCVEERAISLAAVPEAEDESFETQAPGPWLLGRVPWNAAEHRIRAIAAGDPIANLLAVPRQSPCLVVQRRTWSGDLPVTDVRLTYPGDTHSLVARFAPQEG